MTDVQPAIEATRWKVEVPFGTLKGIAEADARRIGAQYNGYVLRSTARLYPDGGEYLGPWEPAPPVESVVTFDPAILGNGGFGRWHRIAPDLEVMVRATDRLGKVHVRRAEGATMNDG